MAKLLILPIVSDNVTIHRKFVKDGKMTLAFKKQLIRVMFSNCAASTLSTFVKMLIIKTTVITPDRPKIALREKQLQQNQGIENISPLLVTRGGALVRKGGASPLKTPNSKRIRTISANDKENCGPVGRMLHAMPISLSKEQREVLALVKSGASIFFTGSAGTGKTFLLRRIISSLSPNSTFVTASTGIAASHLGGSTVHSFAGRSI